jgi:hypothetical protein
LRIDLFYYEKFAILDLYIIPIRMLCK